MTIIEWLLSTVSSTGLLVIIGWLSRNLILTRLKASVQHEFDAKLVTLRADLRKGEESFKADLRSKDAQIEGLRNGALSALASRQAALDKRRLEAVEQLWAGIERLAPLKMAASMMSSFHFEKSLKLAAEDRKVREFFTALGKSFEPDKLEKTDAHKARPFVSEIAWALFAAYQAILYHAVVQVQMLKSGLNDSVLLDTESVTKLTKAALPGYTAYIDQHGMSGCSYLVDTLEVELLKELRRMMRGEESDKTSIEQAAKIMKEVASVKEATLKHDPKITQGSVMPE
jgi:hypothetical protein